jgi:hypothetical protein
MKIILKAITLLFLSAVMFMSCNSFTSPPVISPTDVMETSRSMVKTEIVATLTASPTNTAGPSPLPTFALPTFMITPAVSNPDVFVHPPEARLDYAMAIAPKVYNRLPYMSETGPYGGQYSGCANTNDFSNAVYYGIEHPLDTVTSAFDKYFQQEKWAFTETTTKLVGDQIKVPEVSYDVYRILPSETPALERLQIALRDESSFRGKDYVDVRLVLTHIETKSDLKYLGDFYCGLNNHWLWIHLDK